MKSKWSRLDWGRKGINKETEAECFRKSKYRGPEKETKWSLNLQAWQQPSVIQELFSLSKSSNLKMQLELQLTNIFFT